MAYVHDPTFYVCDDCDTRMKTEDALKYHKERKHDNKEIPSETLNVTQKVENQNQIRETEALHGLKSLKRSKSKNEKNQLQPKIFAVALAPEKR